MLQNNETQPHPRTEDRTRIHPRLYPNHLLPLFTVGPVKTLGAVLLLLGLLAPSLAEAGVLMVNPDGTDGAYRTIGAAVSAAQAGDTILVDGGTRDNPVRMRERLNLNTSGTPEAPITLTASGGLGSVIVESPGSGTHITFSGRYWVVEGIIFDSMRSKDRAVRVENSGNAIRSCVIRNGGGHGIFVGSVSSPAPGVPGFLIEDSEVYDFIAWDQLTSKDAACLGTLEAKDLVIRDNSMHHCSGDAIQLESYGAYTPSMWGRVVIEDNELFTAPDERLGRDVNNRYIRPGENAIDIKSGGSAVIRRNRMYGFGRCRSGTSYGGTGTGSEGAAVIVHGDVGPVDVLDNEMFASNHGFVLVSYQGNPHDINVAGNVINNLDNAGYDIGQDGIGLRFSGSQNVLVCHNTVSDTPGRAILGDSSATNYRIFNNIFSNEGYSSGDAAARILGPDGVFNYNLWHGVDGKAGVGDVTGQEPLFVRRSVPGQGIDCPACQPEGKYGPVSMGDYSLQAGSPAIGAAAVPGDVAVECVVPSFMGCGDGGMAARRDLGALGHCPYSLAHSVNMIGLGGGDGEGEAIAQAAEEGLHFGVEQGVEPVLFPVPDGTAELSAAWNEAGLHFLITVNDNQIVDDDKVDLLIQPGDSDSLLPRPSTEAITVRINPATGVIRDARGAVPGRDFTWDGGVSGDVVIDEKMGGYRAYVTVPWPALGGIEGPVGVGEESGGPVAEVQVAAVDVVVKDVDQVDPFNQVAALSGRLDRGAVDAWAALMALPEQVDDGELDEADSGDGDAGIEDPDGSMGPGSDADLDSGTGDGDGDGGEPGDVDENDVGNGEPGGDEDAGDSEPRDGDSGGEGPSASGGQGCAMAPLIGSIENNVPGAHGSSAVSGSFLMFGILLLLVALGKHNRMGKNASHPES